MVFVALWILLLLHICPLECKLALVASLVSRAIPVHLPMVNLASCALTIFFLSLLIHVGLTGIELPLIGC